MVVVGFQLTGKNRGFRSARERLANNLGSARPKDLRDIELQREVTLLT